MVRHLSLSSALLLFSLAVVPLLSPSPPFLAYFRSAPAAPSPLLLLSLSTARPTHLCSPVVFLPAWWPRYSTLFLVVSRFLLLLTSRLLMAFLLPNPLSTSTSSGSASSSLFWSGVGVGVPPPSGVTASPVNSTAMRVLLPLPLLLTLLPPLGLPLTRLHLWVIQRILCFLPLLRFSRVLYLSLLTPRLLLWPWVLRAPPAVVISDPRRGCFMGLSTFIFFLFLFFFFFPPLLSGLYLWNRYSQRLQIECAACSCGLILHCCLPSNLLCYFFFKFFSLFSPRFCPGHISGTVTRRDSKLSVLLGPAV